jgi:hypothetical protein
VIHIFIIFRAKSLTWKSETHDTGSVWALTRTKIVYAMAAQIGHGKSSRAIKHWPRKFVVGPANVRGDEKYQPQDQAKRPPKGNLRSSYFNLYVSSLILVMNSDVLAPARPESRVFGLAYTGSGFTKPQAEPK